MYFEFSRRSRSTSQPSVGESIRKDSSATTPGDNDTNKSKVGTPSEAYRSFSFRYFNSMKNASNSQLTPHSLQTDLNSLKVVKSSDTIPKSVSFYYQVKTPDTKKSNSFSLGKKESSDSNIQPKIVSFFS
ncbi:hypothetical protein BpHYR1_032770 [Brachionus plicatilis]|uniref:Uncharacterized protein n=1 Tax=Brachionus plicatilis TaxID=10195 RepID=A0A3M7QFV6_BRAPC|nr:hypothetical protein BpHYR1_032770 [Brachionus plicatilis]